VGRLHAEYGEERLGGAGFPFRGAIPDVAGQQIGELVGLVTGQPVMEGVGSGAAVDPAIPLAIVVFVAGPVLETAAPRRIGDEESRAAIAFVKASQMPFAEVRGAISVAARSRFGVRALGSPLQASA
jgi:hypothetical protein